MIYSLIAAPGLHGEWWVGIGATGRPAQGSPHPGHTDVSTTRETQKVRVGVHNVVTVTIWTHNQPVSNQTRVYSWL